MFKLSFFGRKFAWLAETRHVLGGFAILAVLILAISPPLLVILDRWFGDQRAADLMRKWWCRSEFLCHSAWRPYFLVVFACTIAVIGGVLALGAPQITEHRLPGIYSSARVPGLQRAVGIFFICLSAAGIFITLNRLMIPNAPAGWSYLFVCTLYIGGWILFSTPLTTISRSMKASAPLIFAYFLGLSAVSWFLFRYFGRNEITLFSLALVGAATVTLYRMRQRVSPGYWLLLLAVVVFTLQLNAWYYSFIGDEYAFYDWAKGIAEQQSLAEIGRNLFNGMAVYAEHPYLSSIIQAISVRIFDDRNFGWRFSAILASAFSVPLFYYFYNTFLARWVAITASFFVAGSHYLMSFSRIGYNNTQALMAMGAVFCIAAWATKSDRRLPFVMTGVALALCFYVFPAALFLIPVVIWLLLLYRPPRGRKACVDWMVLICTVLIFILPLLFQPQYWSTKLGGTLGSPEGQSNTAGGWLPYILTQSAYAFYSFLFAVHESHYVTVAHQDPLSAALILIGLASLIARIRKEKFAFFVLTGWGMLIFLIGATHQYGYPPTTRMFLLIPWYSLVAAIGLQWVFGKMRFFDRRPILGYAILIGLLALALTLNLYQTYGVSSQYRSKNPNFESSFVRLAQNLVASGADLPSKILLISEAAKHDIARLQTLTNIEYLEVQVDQLLVSQEQNQPEQFMPLATNQVIVFSPLLPAPLRSSYESVLESSQWVECQMPLGDHTIDVWYISRPSAPCEGPASVGPVAWPNPIGIVGVTLFIFALGRGYIEAMALDALGTIKRKRWASWPPRMPFAVPISIKYESSIRSRKRLLSPSSTNNPSSQYTTRGARLRTFELRLWIRVFLRDSGGVDATSTNAQDEKHAGPEVSDNSTPEK